MVNESSPLIALSNYEAVQVVSDAAKKASNSQVATVAKASGKKLLAQAKKYADAAANGRTGLRLLAFLGGGAIVIDSIFCILSNALSLHFIAVLIDVYALFIGIAAIVMESEPDVLPFTTGARSFFGGSNLKIHALIRFRFCSFKPLFGNFRALLRIYSQWDRTGHILFCCRYFSHIKGMKNYANNINLSTSKLWNERTKLTFVSFVRIQAYALMPAVFS